MNDSQPPPERSRPNPAVAESPVLTLVSAGLFLYVGFGLGLVGIGESPIYNGSVAVLVWGARIVGVGLLIVAGMTFMKLPRASLLDLVLCVIAAVGCVVVGLIWIVYGDMQGILLVLFGILNGSAARAAWTRWSLQSQAAVGGPFFDNEPTDHDRYR